jgi:peptidoglycan/xylan/chitin deacetylase (PgdA/CDA1 family)
MSTLRQLLKSSLAAALPPSWLMTRGPRRSASGQIEIALTFDDGPHPEHTPRLLDALGQAGAKGTFFIIGEQALRHPKLVSRIAAEGHELANHTWSHSDPSRTSAQTFLEEVTQTRRLIQDITGRDCRLMRPPKGVLTLGKAWGLWRQQQAIVLWNVDPKDFAMPDASAMTAWLEGYRPQSGDVVLLHDNHPHATLAVKWLGASETAKFVTLSNWLTPVGAVERLTAPSTGMREVAHAR